MSDKLDLSYAIESLKLDLIDLGAEKESWKAIAKDTDNKEDKKLYEIARTNYDQVYRAIDILEVPRIKLSGDSEFLFSMLKEMYQDHLDITLNPEHSRYHDFNKGAMFGMRLTLGSLGYDIDINAWKDMKSGSLIFNKREEDE